MARSGLTFRGEDGKQVADVGHVQVDRNPLGTPTEWRYYAPDGALEQRIVIDVEPSQATRSLSLLNDDGGPTASSGGWSSVRFERTGGRTTASFTTPDGSPARLLGDDNLTSPWPLLSHEIPHHQTIDEMEQAAPAFGILYLTHRAAPPRAVAWSGWRVEADATRSRVRRTWLDAAGTPVLPDDPGWAAVDETWSGRRVVTRRFLDTAGGTATVCGVAEVTRGKSGWSARDLSGADVPLPGDCAARLLP